MSTAAVKAKTNGNGKADIELLSLSKLAMRFDLDRSTARKRLQEAGIEPSKEKATEKLFELTPRVEMVLGATNSKLDAAKLQKTLADARLAEIKVQQFEEDLAPRGEFMDVLQKIFSALFQDLAVRQPSKISAKLFKAKTSSEVAAILRNDTTRAFTSIRNDWEKFLGNGKK